jgi:hypothetical protein
MSTLPVAIGRFNVVFTCAVKPDHGSTAPEWQNPIQPMASSKSAHAAPPVADN